MKFRFASLALALSVAPTVHAIALYSQPPLNAGSGVTSDVTTDPNGSNNDIFAYDDFIAPTAGTVTSISWQGSSLSNGIAGFTIQLLSAEPVTPDTVASNQVVAEYTVAGTAGASPSAVPGWSDFHYDLPVPIGLVANQHYWIGIWANDGATSSWQWASGSGGNGKLYLGGKGASTQYYRGTRMWLPAGGDRSFSLNDANTPPAPVVATLAAGEVGLSYSATLLNGGQPPFNFSTSGQLPPGLTLDSASSLLSGTPTTAGAYSFTVSEAGMDHVFNLTVADTLAITPPNLSAAAVGNPFDYAVELVHGVPPYTLTLTGVLPAGLSFTDRSISGTPSVGGKYPLTVNATDAIGAVAHQDLQLDVASLATPCVRPAGTKKVSGSGRIKEIGADYVKVGRVTVHLQGCTAITFRANASLQLRRRVGWHGFRTHGVVSASKIVVR